MLLLLLLLLFVLLLYIVIVLVLVINDAAAVAVNQDKIVRTIIPTASKGPRAICNHTLLSTQGSDVLRSGPRPYDPVLFKLAHALANSIHINLLWSCF